MEGGQEEVNEMKVVKEEENLELKEKEGKGRERSVGKGEDTDV